MGKGFLRKMTKYDNKSGLELKTASIVSNVRNAIDVEGLEVPFIENPKNSPNQRI